MQFQKYQKIIEALLLTQSSPISTEKIKSILNDSDEEDFSDELIESWLITIQRIWSDSYLELQRTVAGWRFVTTLALSPYMDRLLDEKPMKYSRAAMEILSIIAYRQPVTRGDIEAIRGVAVSAHILHAFEERGWIEVVGQRETLGRPALFATTARFLDDLGLMALSELPTIDSAQSINQDVFALSAPHTEAH
jgi:segregation and condensation protein B